MIAPSSDQPSWSADEDQERDVWWGAYAARTMMPSLVVCLVLTGAIAVVAWSYEARLSAYALVGAVWLGQLIRWAYRTAGYTYRLTSRRLFHNRGFLFPMGSAVELSQVTRVLAEQNWWERYLGVGRVRILCEKAGKPPALLLGVWDPERIAAQIERCARQARKADPQPPT